MLIHEKVKTRQARGKTGEDFAVALYKKAKFQILARGYRFGQFEVDFIAHREKIVHFVEVKTRASLFDANLALSSAQFQRIAAAAQNFMLAYPNQLFQIDALLLDHHFNWERIDNVMISMPEQ